MNWQGIKTFVEGISQGVALVFVALIALSVLYLIYRETMHRISLVRSMAEKHESLKNIAWTVVMGLIIIVLGLIPVALFVYLSTPAGYASALDKIQAILSALSAQALQ